MRQNCKRRVINLIQDIKKLQVNQKCLDVMLILDQTTTPILSSIVPQFLSLGVKNVTKASLIKKPYPQFAGIYFISKDSLHTVVQDFKKEPIYHSINILINTEITPDLMQMVSQSQNVVQRLSYFGELFINTKYLTSNIGLLCRQNELFGESIRGEIKIKASVMADNLLQAIISGFQDVSRLKIYYCNSPYIQELIKIFSIKYKEFVKGTQPTSSNGKKKPLNILLFDRRMDIVSPLVQNFYYLNMVSDIFHVDFQNKNIQLKQGQKIDLNYQDSIFMDYKSKHISKVQTQIQKDFLAFQSQNKAAQYRQSTNPNNVSNYDLKQIIRDIPEFNRKLKSYEEQIEISMEMTQYSKERRLPQIGEIEQIIVSGLDGHGQQIHDKKIIMEKAWEFSLKLKDPEKIVKIMLLMLLCMECSENKRTKFINKIKQYPQYSGVAHFIQYDLPKIQQKPLKLKLSPQKQRIFLCLHQSLVESIMIELLEKGTSKMVNLAVIGEEEIKPKSKFQTIGKIEQKEWIVMTVGGISINQITHLERLKQRYQGMNVSFLTTEILTTWSYLQKLNHIDVEL